MLNVVSDASIVRSSFLNNTKGNRFELHLALEGVPNFGLPSFMSSRLVTYMVGHYIQPLATLQLTALNFFGTDHKWVQLL